MTVKERYIRHNRLSYVIEDSICLIIVGIGVGLGAMLGWAIIVACAAAIL